MFTISSALVLANSFDAILGDDDSLLSRRDYRASWLLMTISGIFCTLGSLAFARAVHDDPPMQPLLRWYHFQSDELLGSWLFLAAAAPIVPYSLLYLSQSGGDYVYFGALAVSIVLVFGCVLFIWACYPNSGSDEPSARLIKPLAVCLCSAFCSKLWLTKHFANDWLAGTWIIFWGTMLAFFVCLALLLEAAAEGDGLTIFVMGTGFVENAIFLIGSAYFVAGSYPDETSLGNDDIEGRAGSRWGSTGHALPDKLKVPFIHPNENF